MTNTQKGQEAYCPNCGHKMYVDEKRSYEWDLPDRYWAWLCSNCHSEYEPTLLGASSQLLSNHSPERIHAMGLHLFRLIKTHWWSSIGGIGRNIVILFLVIGWLIFFSLCFRTLSGQTPIWPFGGGK